MAFVATTLHTWASRRRSRSVTKGPYGRFFAKPPGALLDVGCGVGHHGAAFREQGWVVHGIEPSASAACEAERRGLVVHHGTFDDAGVPEGSFDLVIFNHSLEHIPHPKDALRRAHSVLKPGGSFAVAVPDFGCWQSHLFRDSWFHLDMPRHLQHFTSATLADLAVQVGVSGCFRDAVRLAERSSEQCPVRAVRSSDTSPARPLRSDHLGDLPPLARSHVRPTGRSPATNGTPRSHLERRLDRRAISGPEVSEATYHRWRAQYGGMKADDVKRLKELEAENAKLKRIVADQLLDIDGLKEIARGNF